MVERMNRELVMNYHHEYRQIFDILLDSANYPVVVHCSSGKGRTGIASALILASLGVNSDIIMEDYRLSNDYFNIPSASRYAYNLPARSQEAITTVYSARRLPECCQRRNRTSIRRCGDLSGKGHRTQERGN